MKTALAVNLRQTATDVLHTLPTRQDGYRAIDELVRVTAPGGAVLVSSVPDRAKRFASRISLWKRAPAVEKATLPVRWLVPGRLKRIARRLLRRPATGLPEFLEYDLRTLARSFEARGLPCEVRDFPPDYWSDEFRTSRANLLIRVPRNTIPAPQPPKPHPKPVPPQEPVPSPVPSPDPPPTDPIPQL